MSGREGVLGPGTDPQYSSTGHILYQSGPVSADIWARPFSLDTMAATGEPFRVAEAAANATVARDGTLVYVDSDSQSLVWLSRERTRGGSVGQAQILSAFPSVSPNGRFVAAETLENENLDLWVYELERGARTRLTAHPATDVLPVWSPTGEEIAFSSYRSGNIDVFVRRADGGAEEKAIGAGPANERVSDWSSDGQSILFSLLHPKNGYDIWYARRNETGGWEPLPFLQTASNEVGPKLSPDGRYLAYVSDETGRDEVYVWPFPLGNRKWSISTSGGKQVRWRRDGHELFYVEQGTVVAVPVKTGPDLNPGSPSRLFFHTAFGPYLEANYDVSSDGQRFLLCERFGGPRKIHVVQNWFAAFRQH